MLSCAFNYEKMLKHEDKLSWLWKQQKMLCSAGPPLKPENKLALAKKHITLRGLSWKLHLAK